MRRIRNLLVALATLALAGAPNRAIAAHADAGPAVAGAAADKGETGAIPARAPAPRDPAPSSDRRDRLLRNRGPRGSRDTAPGGPGTGTPAGEVRRPPPLAPIGSFSVHPASAERHRPVSGGWWTRTIMRQ